MSDPFKGFLVLKGNFTQRQLDALGRAWDRTQRGEDTGLPVIQMRQDDEIYLLTIDGKIDPEVLPIVRATEDGRCFVGRELLIDWLLINVPKDQQQDIYNAFHDKLGLRIYK